MVNRRILRSIAAALAICMLLAGWSWLVSPALVETVEKLTGRGGSIDFILRVHFSYAAGLAFLGVAWWLAAFPPADRRVRWILTLIAAHLVVLIAIWVLERIEFTREFSAIRFFSSGALILAAFLAWLNALVSRAGPGAHPLARWFWSLIALAFLLAGLDDYFNVHETIGVRLAGFAYAAGLPEHLVQDSITASYGIGAILFVFAFRRCFRAEMLRQGQLSGWLLIAGIGVYGVAVINDSLDSVVARLFFPASPEPAMNFLEETLEFTAAVLFVCAFAVRLYERDAAMFDRMLGEPSARTGLFRGVSAVLLAGAALAVLLPLGLRLLGSEGGLAEASGDAHEITVFADAGDGLDAVDELAWLPGMGLLAGNEGTDSLLLFDPDGGHRTFASGLGSPDGIAAYDGEIYVAEEANGSISIYGYDGVRRGVSADWESPEGVAIGPDGTLYVADLARRLVVRLVNGRREIVASPLDGLQSPEQLAFDASGNLYITDERARAVFRVSPEGLVETFLDTADGIRTPEGVLARAGHVYVSDNEVSAIHRFDMSGNGGVWIDFARKLDLAGMTFDPDGVLYLAVTSEYRPHNRVLRIAACDAAGC